MKRIILVCLLFLIQYGFGQDDKKDILFSPGVIFQKNLFVETNVLIGEVTISQSKIPVVGVQGWRVGVESNLQGGSDFVIAPKLGYEFSATIYTLRMSAVNYFQNGNSEFRLLPELGFSLGGWANLTYGYGISLHDGNLNNVSKHRLSLSFNLSEKLRKAAWELY